MIYLLYCIKLCNTGPWNISLGWTNTRLAMAHMATWVGNAPFIDGEHQWSSCGIARANVLYNRLAKIIFLGDQYRCMKTVRLKFEKYVRNSFFSHIWKQNVNKTLLMINNKFNKLLPIDIWLFGMLSKPKLRTTENSKSHLVMRLGTYICRNNVHSWPSIYLAFCYYKLRQGWWWCIHVMDRFVCSLNTVGDRYHFLCVCSTYCNQWDIPYSETCLQRPLPWETNCLEGQHTFGRTYISV